MAERSGGPRTQSPRDTQPVEPGRPDIWRPGEQDHVDWTDTQRQDQQRTAQEDALRPPAERPQPAEGAEPAEVEGAEPETARQAAERANREAAERATQREAAERGAWEAARRAANEQAATERAVVERAAAEQAAQHAGAMAAAERAAAARAVAERAAAERAATEATAARVEAERAAQRADAQAAAERAAERAVDEADAHARRRPLLTVEAEADEDDEDESDAGSRPRVSTQELILAGRSDSLQAALASIALRIDALTSTTSTFRNLVSDRITDYAEQVGRLAANAAGDLDDYRHLHERALEQIRRSVGEAEDNIRRLGRTVGDLDSKVGALVGAVRESGDAVDQISTERDQVSDALLQSLGRIEDALSDLTEGKGATGFARFGEMVSALTGERDRQNAVWTQLEAAVVALADDREHESDVIVRLERAVTEMTIGRERGLAKSLARLEGRVDEVASAMTGLTGDDLAATLSRLDTRLKEMTTELVVGRDRETARALAQLSAQVDGIAGLVAEGRTDLSPIEARLNRLARNTAPPAPIDLTELYARFDDLSAAVAHQSAVDLDPTWATAMQRLERLLPSLESLRSGSTGSDRMAGGRPETPASLQDRRELLERFDQLGQQLSEQLEALRRRIALRARPGGSGMDEATIAAIANAVVARLNQAPPEPPPPPPAPAPGPPGRQSMLPPSSQPAVTRRLPPSGADITPERPFRGRRNGLGSGNT